MTSREGFGVRHAGWGGAPPPLVPPTCTETCDGGECHNYPNQSDCTCGSREVIVGKQDPSQTEGDCKTAYCDGSTRENSSDKPEREDVVGDCKVPGCRFDEAVDDLPDNNDITEEDAICNECGNSELRPDDYKTTTQFKCGDGSPEQACLVCVDGVCERPECDRVLDQTVRLDTSHIPVANKLLKVIGGSVEKSSIC